MDIYILRNHQQIGPFSDDATQILLRQGTISANDLAWRPGLPEWQPLGKVLSTLSAPTPGGPNLPPPVPSPRTEEPATAPQLAFLHYFGVTTPAGLSKDDAEELISQATTDPTQAGRLIHWNEERLRLHPELFSTEVQAKKGDRVQFYLEHCQTEGAQYFTGVTKAHCQVLVSFLDVTFPRWDARETQAMEDYFFPAIAEKFPQLVNKPWRGRFRYREGRSAGGGATRKIPTSKLTRPAVSLVAAITRGLVAGLLILAALYLVHRATQSGKAQALPTDNAAAALRQ